MVTVQIAASFTPPAAGFASELQWPASRNPDIFFFVGLLEDLDVDGKFDALSGSWIGHYRLP